MVSSLQNMSRDLSPAEHLVLKCVCSGQSNQFISENTHFSVKSVENAISRSARVFGVTSTENVNLRVLLSVAYRLNFGDFQLSQADNKAHLVVDLGPAA